MLCYVENGKMNMCQVVFPAFPLFFVYIITSKMYFRNFLTSIFIHHSYIKQSHQIYINPTHSKIRKFLIFQKFDMHWVCKRHA